MTYERFLNIILRLKQQDEVINDLYKNKVDLIDFVDPYHFIITELIKEVYGDIGYGWFSWFCNEAEYGHKDFSKIPTYGTDENGNLVKIREAGEMRWGAEDENGKPICYDIKSTWEYLETIKVNEL